MNFRSNVLESDIQRISDIVASTGFFYDYEIPVAAELVEEAFKYGTESGYHFLFAEIDGVVVSYTCYGEIACTKGSYDLFWIVTHNDYRGKGIGKQILEATHKHVKELGGRLLIAETSSTPKYEPTRQFYLSNDYKLEAQINDFYLENDHKVMFVKRL